MFKTLGILLGGHFLFIPANLFSAFRLSVVAFCENTFLFIAFSYVVDENKKVLTKKQTNLFLCKDESQLSASCYHLNL
ncbi:hypothetical protein CAT7_06793 [Carnobacterium sp. AT7]|nr:hypothetical protein CAT7_06793 [Carnobacterium sp. AT7]